MVHPDKLTVSLIGADGRGTERILKPDPGIAQPSDRSRFASWFGYQLDFLSLPSGMYRLSVILRPGFLSQQDGSLVPAELDRVPQLMIYVPPQPTGAPTMAVGERYMFLSGNLNNSPPTAATDDNGAGMDVKEVLARPLIYDGGRIEDSGWRVARFHLADPPHTGFAFPGHAVPADIPNLYPIVNDRSLQEMAARYSGHVVWTLGRVVTLCMSAVIAGCDIAKPDSKMQVVGVYRAFGFAEDMAIGDMTSRNLQRASSFRALDPLVVALRDPGSRAPGKGGSPLPIEGPNAYSTFADGWDLERSLSLVSLDEADPDWTTRTKTEIRSGRPRRGMTKEMIAWMLGFPSEFGSRDDMYRLNEWYYDSPPNDIVPQQTVIFRHGRVVACTPACDEKS